MSKPPKVCQATRFTQRQPRTPGRRIAFALPATLTSAAPVRPARPRANDPERHQDAQNTAKTPMADHPQGI
jgi:hypothetical protein